MSRPREWLYDLHIHGTTPKAMPLDALGEIAKCLAELLGEPAHVRFSGLANGSARLRANVLPEAQTPVFLRLVQARNGEGGAASRSAKRLDNYLHSRGWHAELLHRTNGVVLDFPGAKVQRRDQPIRTIKQVDAIVGSVIKIGGRDESVPMTLKTPAGEFLDMNVKGKELAKELAPHLFGDDIRVHGLATWSSDQDGEWTCTAMEVVRFEPVSSQSLSELFRELSEIPGNGWKDFDDPIAELESMRRDD